MHKCASLKTYQWQDLVWLRVILTHLFLSYLVRCNTIFFINIIVHCGYFDNQQKDLYTDLKLTLWFIFYLEKNKHYFINLWDFCKYCTCITVCDQSTWHYQLSIYIYSQHSIKPIMLFQWKHAVLVYVIDDLFTCIYYCIMLLILKTLFLK